jgi:hypothetical protein
MKRGMLCLLLIFVATPLLGRAAEESTLPHGDESNSFQVEVIAEGLDNPAGLVIQSAISKDEPQKIYFAESGAGRVLCFASNNSAERAEVVTGFAPHALTDQIDLKVGPWALGFVTPTKLATWGGTIQNGAEQIAVYALPEDDKPLAADKPEHIAELPQDSKSVGVGFQGMIVGETSAFLSQGLAADAGTIFKAALIANRLDAPRTLTPSKRDGELHWPTGLCLTPSAQRQYLVAGYLGELSDKRDSRVAFIIPSNGDIALELAPGLFDVVGLVYSPTGQLYALDLAWDNEKAGGVYRLDDARENGRPTCRAVKIASVVRPTSLVFDKSGILYVTALGSGANAKRGQILKITGEF